MCISKPAPLIICSSAGNLDWPLESISSKIIMESHGWTVDVDYYNEHDILRCDKHGLCDSLEMHCGKIGNSTLYGWKNEINVGSVSAVLKENGTLDIYYSNCWMNGTVTLSINGEDLATAPPLIMVHFTTKYKAGDVLKIKENGHAIIKLYRLQFQ